MKNLVILVLLTFGTAAFAQTTNTPANKPDKKEATGVPIPPDSLVENEPRFVRISPEDNVDDMPNTNSVPKAKEKISGKEVMTTENHNSSKSNTDDIKVPKGGKKRGNH